MAFSYLRQVIFYAEYTLMKYPLYMIKNYNIRNAYDGVLMVE
jgi:hypothetical protein